MSACRSCDAPIIWTTTTRGKKMPVDREPVEDGNVQLDEAGVLSDTLGGLLLEAVQADPEQRLYVSHFVTCPHRKDWRR